MPFSLFELFKIGIGPSSSHTVGPMVAGKRFLTDMKEQGRFDPIHKVRVELYGSLALTGKGHSTDVATLLGLCGELPDEVDPDSVPSLLEEIRSSRGLRLDGQKMVTFNEAEDLIFKFDELLPHHTNGMRFLAFDASGTQIAEQDYYSIGGGFVATAEELEDGNPMDHTDMPFPFETAAQMLTMGREHGFTIAEMTFRNELTKHSETEIRTGLRKIRETMRNCVDRGLKQTGILPGGLKVKRRAFAIHEQLEGSRGRNEHVPHESMDWVSLYAIAVNEENAAGGRIVTAPTNGAAGILPAVLRYYEDFYPGITDEKVDDFLLTATAIGSLIKLNASISGAEVGCQGEVGSACSMAAAGLCAALGGTNEQIENAAEIAMEHHLGMTCDPVAGLVQVPCIERNAMGAVKAINAASLALKGDGTHFISLDTVIETMRQTGLDMHSRYKETSQGGLAVNVTEC
ncbi:L-serine ammonia-lyase [Aestuariispira insulae]|uniref:L-serine dehydratase n=1 Tax=Aestuariispira insulae TaxID=1461337 RepID=A0A3D9HV49_9PROT|nr:L-serine ammonia-lyase [Aestuariispira insulae]RED53394.1 L-serine ammonia-lyase [Aestuariispira insulae]